MFLALIRHCLGLLSFVSTFLTTRFITLMLLCWCIILSLVSMRHVFSGRCSSRALNPHSLKYMLDGPFSSGANCPYWVLRGYRLDHKLGYLSDL